MTIDDDDDDDDDVLLTIATCLQGHEKTKKEVVDALKAEVVELKKELQQRKKMIAMQQQLIQHGSETYNKVNLVGFNMLHSNNIKYFKFDTVLH